MFATPKKPSVFHIPKNSLLAKISDPKKNHSEPPSLKYVSGAPGIEVLETKREKKYKRQQFKNEILPECIELLATVDREK